MKIMMLANARAVHTQRWARALAGRGHDVTVISIRSAVIDNVTVLHRSFGDVDRSKVSALFGYLWLAIRLPFDLRRIKPDVVNPHYCITHGAIAALAGARPRVVNVWGSDLIWSSREKMPFWRKTLIRFSLTGADAIVSTSRFMEDAVEALLPNHPHITLVPFGVDTTRFTPAVIMAPSAKIRIGFVKSFAQKYAPDIFVEAAALAAKDCDNIEFIMAGRGPLLDEIRLLAVNKGLEDRISFSGFIPHDEVASFMRTLDVLVNCSRTESFGVVICEASASGLPVIATDVGGVRETLLDGETGILVPSEDPKALAKAMIKLAANTEMRERMGSAGRKFIAAAYEWDQCIDLMTDVLERAAAKNCHNVSYYRSNPNSESASAFDL